MVLDFSHASVSVDDFIDALYLYRQDINVGDTHPRRHSIAWSMTKSETNYSKRTITVLLLPQDLPSQPASSIPPFSAPLHPPIKGTGKGPVIVSIEVNLNYFDAITGATTTIAVTERVHLDLADPYILEV